MEELLWSVARLATVIICIVTLRRLGYFRQ